MTAIFVVTAAVELGQGGYGAINETGLAARRPNRARIAAGAVPEVKIACVVPFAAMTATLSS